jgi:mannose-6-phosphate isomerase-like protein (cupin superfamily)
MNEQRQSEVAGPKFLREGFGRVGGFSIAVLVLFVLRIPSACAADPSSFLFWRSTQLDDLETTLRLQVDATKAAHEQLLIAPSTAMFYWGGSREGEVHQKFGDFCLVRSGEGTVLIGGKLVGGKPSHSGDLHGTLEGGTMQQLATGDVFYIPANTPHQWQMASGKHLYIEMIKVETKPGIQDQSQYLYWSSAKLAALEKELKSKLDGRKHAQTDLVKSRSFTTVLVHREASAAAADHQNLADFHLIIDGEGTMSLGGTLVDGEPSGPMEMRGTSIKGGTEQRIGAGDLLYIPPNMPYQFQAEPGKQFTELVLKVSQ